MAPNAQVAGQALIVDAMVDATARAGGMALIIDAMVDATAWVGGIALIVEAIPLEASGALLMQHYHHSAFHGGSLQ